MNQSEIAWEPVGRLALGVRRGDGGLPVRAESRSWLPEPVAERFDCLGSSASSGATPGRTSSTAHHLARGFIPGSQALHDFVDRLPVVDPGIVARPTTSRRWIARLAGGAGSRDRLAGCRRRGRPRDAATKPFIRSDTIILDVGASAVMDLAMAGLALPSTPMSEVVANYSYDLLADGRWSTGVSGRWDRSRSLPRAWASPRWRRACSSRAARRCRKADALSPGDVIHAPCGQVSFREIHDPAHAGLLLSDGLAGWA